MSALEQWKSGDSKNGYDHQYSLYDSGKANLILKKRKSPGAAEIIFIFFFCSSQDDNFSLSLLNELSHKYGIQTHLSHSPLPQKLEELRDFLRQEVKKELKIMEGAENLRKVATDKKSVSNVNVIVKKSNSKLTELQQELQELESQILVSQGHALNSSGTGTDNTITINTSLDKIHPII